MKNKRQEEKAEMFTGISFKWRDFRLQDIIENDEHDLIKEETDFIAFYGGKKTPIKGTDLWDAKKKAIALLKIPKSKQGLLAIKSKKSMDAGDFRYEGKVNEDWVVKPSNVGSKNGWHFSNKKNFSSALYKTKKEAEIALDKYLKTDKFDTYGTAEGKVNEDSYHSGAVDDFIKKNEEYADIHGTLPRLKVFGDKGDSKFLNVTYDALRQISKILKTMKI